MSTFTVVSAAAVDTARWDDVVRRCPGGTVFQSTAWARHVAHRGAVRFLTACDEQQRPVGLLLVEKRAGAPRHPVRRLLGIGDAHYTWRHGPLAADGEPGAVVDALLAHVDREAAADGVRAIIGVTPPLLPASAASACETTYRARGYAGTRAATMLVDLRPTAEALWRALAPSARKAVTRSERDGITVDRLAPDEPLDAYHRLLEATRRRLVLPMPPAYPTSAMRRALHERGAACEVFVARRGGTLLGGLGVIGFGAAIVEIGAAQSDEAVAGRLYTGDAIKWAVMRWAKTAGFDHYDLGGVAVDPADAKAAGIRQFKAKWGGRLVEHGRYDRHQLRLPRRLLDGVRRVTGAATAR